MVGGSRPELFIVVVEPLNPLVMSTVVLGSLSAFRRI